MLGNVVEMLAASGAIHAGQYVVHTSGRHGLAVLAPAAAVGARPIALHPAMTFTGTDVDLPRLAGCVFGVTAGAAERELAERSSPTSAAGDVGARGQAHALPRRSRPRREPPGHPGLAGDGDARRGRHRHRRRPTTRPTRCARCSRPRSTTRSPTATPR
jgi:hypothetical protein